MRWFPPDLADRVPGPELMDDVDNIGGPELEETLRQLRVVNRRLGGYSTTRAALDDLAARVELPRDGPLTVLDVGGGTGDVAQAIVEWAGARGFGMEVTAVDIHAETAGFAVERLRAVTGARAEVGDLFAIPDDSYDLVHAALFLHHFDGNEAVRALDAMARIARVGVIVNDLRRGWLPWLLIRWITGVFSRNRLIRYDAPLSVARAFREADWKGYSERTGLALRWRRTWAFRWAVTGVVGSHAG